MTTVLKFRCITSKVSSKVRAQMNRLNPQKNICFTSQVIEEIKQLMKTTHSYTTKRFRPPVDNTKDIQLIVELDQLKT